MYDKQYDIGAKLKPVERRLKVLDEHIKQADIYMEFKPLNQKRKQMKPKYQADYTEAHRREFTIYEAAERYLKDVMNGKTNLPLKAWRAERDKLTAEQKRLNGEYVSLKGEVKEVDKIRRSVDNIMREENRRMQPTRKHDMEL